MCTWGHIWGNLQIWLTAGVSCITCGHDRAHEFRCSPRLTSAFRLQPALQVCRRHMLIIPISAFTSPYKMLQSVSWTSKLWNGWCPRLLGHCRCTKYSFHSAPFAADTATEHTLEGLQLMGKSGNFQNGEKPWKIKNRRQFDLSLILADLKLCRERRHAKHHILSTN